MGKLTSAKVRNAKPAYGPGGKPAKRAYQDGDGLFLLVAPSGARSWMLRVQVDGKRRDIGLGAADVDGLGREAFGNGDNRLSELPLMQRKSLSLAEAREKGAALRKLAKAGNDPKVERDRQRVKIPVYGLQWERQRPWFGSSRLHEDLHLERPVQGTLCRSLGKLPKAA